MSRADRTKGDGGAARPAGSPDGDWVLVEQSRYDPSEDVGLTATVVRSVARVEGVAPMEIRSPPLYDVVDTAALEEAFFESDARLVSDEDRNTTEFRFRGLRIVLRSDGWVLVHERRAP